MDNTRTTHPPEAWAYARQLVAEYDKHEREQDRLWKNRNPDLVTKTDRKRSKPGGF